MPPELHALIARAQAGDLSAQDGLVRAYQSRVAGFIAALAGDSSAVEDIAQMTFVKALLGIKKLREPGRFEAWLFRLARNACYDHFRKERWRKIFVPFLASHGEAAEEPRQDFAGPEPERLAAIWAALQKLPPAQRELLVLLQERDWTYEELAEITGSTASSVKSRLFRARAELKQLLPHD